MTERHPCPVCGAEETTAVVTSEKQTYGVYACDVRLHMRHCHVCTSEFAGAAESKLNKKEMVALKKRALNLLSGKRVGEIRKKFGLTLTQANEVFGGGPVAFSKYEHDDLCQSEQMDKLIDGAEKCPNFFAYLVDRAGIKLETTNVSIAKNESQSVVLDVIEFKDYIYDPKSYRKINIEGAKYAG